VSSLGGWSDDGSGVSKPNLITTNTPMPDTARGGALLDSAGRLVGVIAGPAHGGAGGLATPADMARSVLDQLANSGHVEHGELGIRATDDDDGGGVRVSSVPSGSPAAKAKVKVGDVIVAVNAVRIPDSATLVYEVQRHRAGDEVTLSVSRGGKKLNLAVTLGHLPPSEPGSATAATTTALSSAH
jgi:S1-C subfamily serine protease